MLSYNKPRADLLQLHFIWYYIYSSSQLGIKKDSFFRFNSNKSVNKLTVTLTIDSPLPALLSTVVVCKILYDCGLFKVVTLQS